MTDQNSMGMMGCKMQGLKMTDEIHVIRIITCNTITLMKNTAIL